MCMHTESRVSSTSSSTSGLPAPSFPSASTATGSGLLAAAAAAAVVVVLLEPLVFFFLFFFLLPGVDGAAGGAVDPEGLAHMQTALTESGQKAQRRRLARRGGGGGIRRT